MGEFIDYEYYNAGIRDILQPHEVRERHIRQVRAYVALQTERGVSYRAMHEHFADLYRDAPAIFVDKNREEWPLDMDVLETTTIDWWFRDIARPIADGFTPRVRAEARPRYALLATILSAYNK